MGLIVLAAIVGVSAFTLARHGKKTPIPVVAAPTTHASASPTVAAVAGPAGQIPVADITARASSTLAPEDGVSYGIANTLDGIDTTAWNSDGAAVGHGVVTLTYTFSRPFDLRWVTIRNGYVSSKASTDAYHSNARIREVTVATDTGKKTLAAKDTPNLQRLAAPMGKTTSVTLTMVSVYPGSKFDDLALTDIRFVAVGGTS